MTMMEYLILRTVDGDDTLSITEHPCADARALLATLATGRLIVCSVTWCGRTMEVEAILA
jgi:hypothetical protein